VNAGRGWWSSGGFRVKDDANVRIYGERFQRTIARPAYVAGTGFLTGAIVRLRFVPAPPSCGVVFVRTDLRPRVEIPARVTRVTGTNRRTTLGNEPARVGLVEHVLAALAGLRIDNCFVELDAPEPPGLDGSSRAFVDVLLDAGIVRQSERRPMWCVGESIVLRAGEATLALHPSQYGSLTLSYFLDYGPGAPIARQVHTQALTPAGFVCDLAPCRTFILQSEAEALLRQGIGTRTTTTDLLVFGPRGPIDNCLRFANEPARHKVLDLVGDLSLLGADLCGHVVAFRSGHPMNVELVRSLHARIAPAASSSVRLAA
jgi:UDP-3-O-[3-hydroxymyristoyl] N-acetylglucosamine deacetylase